MAVLMKTEDYWDVMLYWMCSSDVSKDCSALIFQVKQTSDTQECGGNYIPDDTALHPRRHEYQFFVG